MKVFYFLKSVFWLKRPIHRWNASLFTVSCHDVLDILLTIHIGWFSCLFECVYSLFLLLIAYLLFIFKTGAYIDKKCPFTGNVSIRGRILAGTCHSAKMNRTIIVRRNYLHFIKKYQRYSPLIPWCPILICTLLKHNL
jgi:hypothetical protein